MYIIQYLSKCDTHDSICSQPFSMKYLIEYIIARAYIEKPDKTIRFSSSVLTFSPKLT